LAIGRRFDVPFIQVLARWKRKLDQFIGPLKLVGRTKQEEVQQWVSLTLSRTNAQPPILFSKE
jgi:hypothetical protein